MNEEKLMKLRDWYINSEKLVQQCELYWDNKLKGKTSDELTEKEKRMYNLISDYVYKREIVKLTLNSNGIFIM